MEIQRQIRENNLEVQSFLRDLEQWEKSIKQGSSARYVVVFVPVVGENSGSQTPDSRRTCSRVEIPTGQNNTAQLLRPSDKCPVKLAIQSLRQTTEAKHKLKARTCRSKRRMRPTKGEKLPGASTGPAKPRIHTITTKRYAFAS